MAIRRLSTPGLGARPTAVCSGERRPLLTPKGLAEYLSLSERTVRELLRTGELPSYKVAGSRRIDPQDVEAWLAARRRERSVA